MSISKPKVLTGKAAIAEYQRQVSPKGVAAAEAAAKKALEQRYPGMFLPETRRTSGVRRGR